MIKHVLRLIQTMRALAFLSALAIIGFGDSAQAFERQNVELSLGRQTRTFTVFWPDNLSRRTSWPVLIAFHPGLADGAYMERTSRFHSRTEDYIVVYPDGFRRSWNAGDCCGRAVRRNIDDLAFFDAMMSALDQIIKGEAGAAHSTESRAYLTGFSNGAIMAYHIACNRPNRVAAIAPVASSYSALASCDSRGTPVLHIHGLLDRSAPYDGGSSEVQTFDQRYQTPARDTVAAFAGQNNCNLTTDTVTISKLRTNCNEYRGCGGLETVICLIEGQGHTWPGTEASTMFGGKFGPGRLDIDGSGAVLDFFNSLR